MRQRSAIAAIVLGGIGGLVVLAAAWELAARAYDEPLMMPRLGAIVEKALALCGTTDFLGHARQSLVVLVRGYVTAAIVGILLAFALGQAATRAITLPIVSFLAGIPFVAAAPLMMVWYGLNDQAKVTAVAIATALPIARGTLAWFDRNDFAWPAATTASAAGEESTVDRVALTVGGVVSGLRQGLPMAVAALVLMEFVGSNAGLGYLLLSTASQFDTVGMLAIFLAIAVPTAIVALIFDSIERRFETRLR
jgi:ABC-type nitrate/sulfonate/bicarbonate transport system permease component